MRMSLVPKFVFKSELSYYTCCFSMVFVLSSIIYICVDWYWYYNSKAADKDQEMKFISQSIHEVVKLSNDINATRGSLSSLLNVIGAKTEVKININGSNAVKLSNDKVIDLSRTQILKKDSFQDNGRLYEISCQWGIRPGVAVALWRAWSFSILDFIEDPKAYMKYRLYSRSTPLLVSVLIIGSICLMWFRYWRKLYEENSSLYSRYLETKANLNQTVNELNIRRSDIDKIKNQNELTLTGLRRQLKDRFDTSAEALKALESKISDLSQENNLLWSENEEIESKLISLKKVNEEIENGWNSDRTKISELSSQLQELDHMVNNINAADIADKMVVTKNSRVFKKLKDQLKKWVQSQGKIKKSLASHGTKGVVARYISKIDQDFLDEFFVIAKNDEYSPAEKGTIKIEVAPEGTKDYSGTLLVYLGADSGCCIALSYITREKAPTEKVGFILAVLLRAVCKEFEEYKIK